MSCRVDVSPLLHDGCFVLSPGGDCIVSVTGSCVVSAYAGHGVRGDAVPSTGAHGPSPIYNDLSLPADASKEYRWGLVTPPASGALKMYENGSFEYVPSGSGLASFTYRLWEDGVDKGTAVVTMSFLPTLSLPTLSLPTVTAIGPTYATPRVTLTY